MQRLYDASGGDWKAANKMLEAEKQASLHADWKAKTDASGEETGTFDPVQKPSPEEFRSCYFLRRFPELLEKYAVGDVRFLPVLHKYHSEHRYWSDARADRVWNESYARLSVPVEIFKDVDFMKQAPVGWADIKRVDRFSPGSK